MLLWLMTAAHGQVLLTNGDFERGDLSGFAGNQTAAIDSTTAGLTFPSGTWAAQVTAYNGTTPGNLASDTFRVTHHQVALSHREEIGSQVLFMAVTDGSAFLGGAVTASTAAFVTAAVDASSLCAEDVIVSWSNQYVGTQDEADSYVDDVRKMGTVCAEYVDGDGDGWCTGGIDLDGDGTCFDANEIGVTPPTDTDTDPTDTDSDTDPTDSDPTDTDSDPTDTDTDSDTDSDPTDTDSDTDSDPTDTDPTDTDTDSDTDSDTDTDTDSEPTDSDTVPDTDPTDSPGTDRPRGTPTDDGEPPPAEKSGGCGCATPPSSGWWWVLPLLAGLRRSA